MEESKEWQMVVELLRGYDSSDFDLYPEHLSFLRNPNPKDKEEQGLHDLLDPYSPITEQCPNWKIKKLYWLYEWKCNKNFIPYEDFDLEDIDL